MTRAAIFSAFLLCCCVPVDSTRARAREVLPDLLSPVADLVHAQPDLLERPDLGHAAADLRPACELQPDNGGCGCEGSPCCGGPNAAQGFCVATGAVCHALGGTARTDTGTLQARCATCGGNGEECCALGGAECDEGLSCYRWAADSGATGLCEL